MEHYTDDLIEGDIMEYIIRGKALSWERRIHPRIGVSYHVWKEFPEEYSIKDIHVGKQVWMAGTPKTVIWTLVSIHKAGVPMYPQGGLSIKKKGSKIIHSVELDTCILHPDNFKRVKAPVRTKLLPSLPAPIEFKKKNKS
jgi:hypothetical protein